MREWIPRQPLANSTGSHGRQLFMIVLSLSIMPHTCLLLDLCAGRSSSDGSIAVRSLLGPRHSAVRVPLDESKVFTTTELGTSLPLTPWRPRLSTLGGAGVVSTSMPTTCSSLVWTTGCEISECEGELVLLQSKWILAYLTGNQRLASPALESLHAI